MLSLLLAVGRLALGFAAILGPVLLVLILCNARDRRHGLLAAIVQRELNVPALRGLTTVRMQGLFPHTDKVSVELWQCSRDQVWDIMERLTARLPSWVQVEVNGSAGSRGPQRWSLRTAGHCRTCYS